ncbi:MAG: DUF3179 domain-containing protein [Candidatus Hinthialibacter antarcticus]|nr:DUF3179 domain-containing protein [Candidatus Hinthialibacter antarcticus]
MGLFCSTKSFWPQGRELYVALGLVGVIAATCYFNICFMCDKVEQQAMAAASSPPVFDTETASIDTHQIFAGGPPKDGIPALTDPRMLPAVKASFMEAEDRVVGVEFDGEARAYPLKILQWHEIVNAETGETSFAVVYCPLCDSTTVFDRRVDDEVLEFGVSGLLYQSNVLLYDRQAEPDDESLWSQMQGEAVAGKRTGQPLALLPHQLVTWQEWTDAHPDTQVLSNKTGHKRNYQGNVYQAYFDGDNLMFPINHHDKRLPIKQPVLGLFSNGESKAYPLAMMKEGFEISDEVGGEKVALKKLGNDRVWVEAGPAVEVVHSFWFAWSTFYPETQIYDGSAIQVADGNSQMKDAR